jgi:hypothetical protein
MDAAAIQSFLSTHGTGCKTSPCPSFLTNFYFVGQPNCYTASTPCGGFIDPTGAGIYGGTTAFEYMSNNIAIPSGTQGVQASAVIASIAQTQTSKIDPEVLLVTLEKEHSLISYSSTTKHPLPWKKGETTTEILNHATGCPVSDFQTQIVCVGSSLTASFRRFEKLCPTPTTRGCDPFVLTVSPY